LRRSEAADQAGDAGGRRRSPKKSTGTGKIHRRLLALSRGARTWRQGWAVAWSVRTPGRATIEVRRSFAGTSDAIDCSMLASIEARIWSGSGTPASVAVSSVTAGWPLDTVGLPVSMRTAGSDSVKPL